MTLPMSVRVKFASGKACVYCGAPATEVDHVRPRSRGGTDDDSNLTGACRPCNMSKGDRLITEWSDLAKVLRAVAVEPKVYAGIVPMRYEALKVARRRDRAAFPEGVDGTYADTEIRDWYEASGRAREEA